MRFWASTLAAGVLLRAGVIAVACLIAGISLSQFALMHDGWEYMRLARAMAHGGIEQLDPATLRLYPGYPLLIALLGAGRAYVLPGLLISILCGSACGPAAARLGCDRRIAWWMLALTPSWLLYSSALMSDSLALLLTVSALTLMARRSYAWAGLIAGIAFWVRPVSVFLFVPLLLEAAASGGGRAMLRALAAGAPFPLLYLISSRLVLGSAIRSVHQYTFQDYAAPLSSLLNAAHNPNLSRSIIAYEFAVLALTWIGAFGLWRRVRSGEPEFRPLLIWHIIAALFYLLLPSSWAFQALDRFYLAVWPTTLIGIAPWLPPGRRLNISIVVVLGICSIVLAVRWLVNLAAVFPFAERAF